MYKRQLCTYSTVSYESEDEGTIYEDVKIALSVIESTDSSIAVSYTHLDVYKRQLYKRVENLLHWNS